MAQDEKSDYRKFIKDNFGITVTQMRLLDSHFGTELYLADTDCKKYIVKRLPLKYSNAETEGKITDYLSDKGILTARFLKAQSGEYSAKTESHVFTVQSYIEGITYDVNSAPAWVVKKSAETLGRIINALSEYGELPVNFGQDFFSADVAVNKCRYYEDELKKSDSSSVIEKYRGQISHLKRVSEFDIDTSKLTYANSHGDYHIGQLIVSDSDVTVIDWASASKMPVSLEVITSFVFASPSCKSGVIDAAELKAYIDEFTEYYPLTDYDIKMIPYIFYFWHTICNYSPTEQIPASYQNIANLITNTLNWLNSHVDELSSALS